MMQPSLRTSVFAFLLALALGAGNAGAQDVEDIFDDGAFESAVAAGQASEDANKLVWLSGVSLASTTNLVLPQPLVTYASVSQFVGKGFLKATRPTVGSLFVSYTYGHTLWASTNDGLLKAGYARLGLDPAAPVYTLSEFHLSFDLNKVVFLRLGNQLVDWGASAVWSPADFINRRAPDPNGALDTRAGKPGLRVHIPWAAGNLFVFADASRSLTGSGEPRDLVKTGTLGVKADTTVAGWNLGLVGNAGQEAPTRLGLTASGALAGVDLWGEAGAVLPLRDDTFSWAASLGGERSWGIDSEWTLRAEGFWNPEGHGEEALVPAVLAQFQPYYWGQLYTYTELSKQKLWGPSVAASLSATVNWADRSGSALASLRTSFPGLVPLTFSVQYNGGAAQREFTLATGGPAWTLGLRSFVEF